MNKGLMKKSVITATMCLSLALAPQTAMAATGNASYQMAEMFEANDWSIVMNHLTADDLNTNRMAGSGDPGKAALETGSGYVTGAVESVRDDFKSGKAADAFAEGAIENGKKGFISGLWEGAGKSWRKARDNGDWIGSAVLKALGGGAWGGIKKFGSEAIKGGIENAGKQMAQNANTNGVAKAREGYDSVMNAAGDNEYIVYQYVFENGDLDCSYMIQCTPITNSEKYLNDFHSSYFVSDEYDLTGYGRSYNVFTDPASGAYIVGPFSVDEMTGAMFIPYTNDQSDRMISNLIDNIR